MNRFFDCISDFIFVSDRPEKAEVIFVPGGDYPDCAVRAAGLYREGFAPFVLPSGCFSKLTGRFTKDPRFGTEWEYLRQILLAGGVPDSAILKEDRATFTWENAIFSRKVLEERGLLPKTAILVCQAFHARRCLMYYQQQFPETRLLVCPVETKAIAKDNWFLDEDKIDVVLGEMERCGGQFHEIMKDRLKEGR
jgi:uncharacterized SAM-binding protein YcdF (DUF218 family)